MKRALILVVTAACTQTTTTQEIPAECLQEDRVAEIELDDNGPGVAWLGGIRLLERDDRETGATQGTLGASFYDVTNFSTEYGVPLELSRTCIGITGQPAQVGTRTVLPVTHVRVDGVTGGPLTLANSDGGALTHGPVPSLYAGGPVTVHVEGADGGFPSVDFTPLTPPERIQVTEPDLSGSYKLGDDGILLKWTPSSSAGGNLGIDLVVVTGTTRAVVSCVVKDDGCHKIESGLLEWLRAGSSEPISVFFRRSVSEARLIDSSVDGGSGASLQLTVETKGKVTP